MSPLQAALSDYLTVRRTLGYKLERTEKLLGQFVAYLEERDMTTITVEHALTWAMLPAGGAAWRALRMSVVRGFATHLQTIDPACEVPAAELLPSPPHRATPFLYSEEQVAALIEAAETLRGTHPAATYRTLIGLLTVTGMRIGEALALDRGDIDPKEGAILVQETKFAKSRELALHASTIEAVLRYLGRPDRPRAAAGTAAVFVSARGARLAYRSASGTFARLVDRAGIEPRSASCRPRLHDLRHSFAVRTLLNAYSGEGEPQERLALLSTYLGHADPAHTYWYLSASPELMGLAAGRLERYLGARS